MPYETKNGEVLPGGLQWKSIAEIADDETGAFVLATPGSKSGEFLFSPLVRSGEDAEGQECFISIATFEVWSMKAEQSDGYFAVIDKPRCCIDCSFYDFGNSECRKRAPNIPTGAADDRAWPLVSPEDWCGEYEERK